MEQFVDVDSRLRISIIVQPLAASGWSDRNHGDSKMFLQAVNQSESF